MSKKLKKNLETITKMKKGPEKRDRVEDVKPDFLVAARLGDSRPAYLDEMVKNYINTANTR